MIKSFLSYLKNKKQDPEDQEKKEISLESLLNVPNIITLVRAIVIIPLGAAFVQRSLFLFGVMVLVFVSGDILDGCLAFLWQQRTRFGHIFDSSVDKISLLVLLFLALIFHLVPLWLVGIIILINAIQLIFTWHYFVVQRKWNFPKTYFGPFIGLSFIASVFARSDLVILLYITTVTLSVNHLYYYLKGLNSAWFIRLKERLVSLGAILNHICLNSKITKGIVLYYQDKVRNRSKNNMAVNKNYSLTLANLMTVSRIILILPIIYLYQADLYVLAVLLIGLFILLDFVDGYVARRFSRVTKAGQILDASVDKYAFFTFLLFCFLEKRIPGWLFILVCLRLVAVSIIAGLVFFFTKARLPIAYFSFVSVVALIAYIVFLEDFLLLAVVIFTIQLIVNYLYQGFVIIRKNGFRLKL